WYSGVIPFATIAESTFALEDRLVEAISRAGPLRLGVSISWVKSASERCRAGRTPLSIDYPRTIQAAQLALAISPRDLLMALAVVEEVHPQGSLLGLSRAAEWLGRATGGRVLVVVPETLSGSDELDGINFDPIITLPRPAPPIEGSTEGQPVNVWPVL